MKKTFTLFVAVLFTVIVFSQSPQKMSYQAIVRNASGVLVKSSPVGIKISILQTTSSGIVVYGETHIPTANIDGLISLEIGSGTVITGTFATINWSSGIYFLKTEIDPTGGTNYTISGVSQILSVPYAFYAETSGKVSNVTVSSTGDILYLGENRITIPGLSLANQNKLVFSNFNDIYSCNIDGTNLTQLTSGLSIDCESKLNYSKTKIAFISNRTGVWQIFSMNIDGSGVQQLTTTGASGGQDNGLPGDVDWTPEGKLLYIKGNKIYKMNSDGSNVIEIATAPSDYWSKLRCSPKGDKIAAQTQGSWAYTETMYLMNVDGSGMTVIASDLPGAQWIGCFSNDGKRFLYSYDLSGHEESSGQNLNDQIVSVKLDGTGNINLSANKLNGSNDLWPAYSSDGSKIYFINNIVASGTFYIWVMNADGSNRTKLLDGGPYYSVDCK
jgi:Tol biopolymer transport system component